MEFLNKRILITGAVDGIGKETAMLLCQFGAKLVLIDIDKDGLRELLKLIGEDGNYAFHLDLLQTDKIEGVVSNTVEKCGRIDGFVHCVGVRSRRPLSMLSTKVLNDVMAANFGSFIEFIRCISKKNNYNEGLSIIGISSIASQRGAPSVSAYAASKAAIDGAVRCLAKELASKKIRVNTVVPGQINTTAYGKLREISGGEDDKVLDRQYLGLGNPSDVANVIAFLLSDKSRLITGAAIPVDGGFLSS